MKTLETFNIGFVCDPRSAAFAMTLVFNTNKSNQCSVFTTAHKLNLSTAALVNFYLVIPLKPNKSHKSLVPNSQSVTLPVYHVGIRNNSTADIVGFGLTRFNCRHPNLRLSHNFTWLLTAHYCILRSLQSCTAPPPRGFDIS